MGINKKYALCIMLLFLVVKPTNAQLFRRPDSVSVWSAFSIGIGGYYGINQFKPQTDGLIYENQSGYDQGVIGRLQVKITPHWRIITDCRLVRKNALISMYSPAFAEQFTINSTGNQIYLSAAYRFTTAKHKKEIVTIYSGLTRNRVKQLATNIVVRGNSPITEPTDLIPNSTFGNDYFEDGPIQIYYSISVGFSKEFTLIKKFNVIPFYEFEWKKDALEVVNGASYPSGPSVSFTALYNQFNFRLGLLINY